MARRARPPAEVAPAEPPPVSAPDASDALRVTVAASDTIHQWPLDRIKPYKRNAKNHPPHQVELLAKIIAKHGFDQPIVVDGKGVVVKGHGRLLAARHLGLETAPVIVRDLTAAQAAEARIADNRVGEFGWDFEALVADVVDGLQHGLDIDLIGFSRVDLGLDVPVFPPGDESDQGKLSVLDPKPKQKRDACCPKCGHEFSL